MNLFKHIIYPVCVVLIAALSACHHSPKEPSNPGRGDQPVHRTMLVYMVASNNLGNNYDNLDIKEMQLGADKFNGGRLLIYHATPAGKVTLKEILNDGTIDTLKVYDSAIPSVSIERMSSVFTDMQELAPAHDYGLVLWSHSTGWLQDGIADDAAASPKSFGQDFGKKMNISSLAQAIPEGLFSFIYFDSCYMGSVESLYELRRCSPTIIASAIEVPVYGMPYDSNMPCFFADEPRLIDAARNTYEYYMAMFDPEDRTVSIAVINTAALDDLAAATRDIYANAAKPWPTGFVPQKFVTSGTCFYYDYGHYIESLESDPDRLERWRHAMDATILYKASSPRIWNVLAINHFSGLSTYIFTGPSTAATKAYNTLQWYSDVASAFFE